MTLLNPDEPRTTPLGRPRFTARDYYVIVSLLFLTVSIVYVLYKAFIPETVLTVSVHPLPVTTHYEGSSRSIRYDLHYCKTVDAPSSVVRELRAADTHTIVSLYTSGYSLPLGCDVVEIVEPMPAYIPPGRYVMRITFTYQRNFITSPYTFVTEPFTLE